MNDQRFLAWVLLIALAYALATLHGQRLRQLRIDHYAGRLQEHRDKTSRQSDFSLGLYGQRWIYAMALWHHWAGQLLALKPHKQHFFRRGLQSLSLIQQAF